MPSLNLEHAFAQFPVLTTERFLLRQLTLDDTDAVYRTISDPQVMRYFGSRPITARTAAQARIEDNIQSFVNKTGIRWAITYHTAPICIGTCGFWRIDTNHLRAEIGYELAHEHWGKGVMTEALRPMLAFGFESMRLHSIEAQIHPANLGSRRVLEKLGFVQEGYFRENFYDLNENQFTDTAVFSLLGVRG